MQNERSSRQRLMAQSTRSESSGDSHRRCLHCRARSLSICAALNATELHDLENLGPEISFASKDILFSEDDKARNVFNLTQGVARLYKIMPDGRRQIVGFALPGDFLGATHSERYNFSADAVTPIAACRFSRSKFLRFVEDKPGILRRMHEFETRELHLARNQMLLLGSNSAEQRIALFLIGWRDRLGRFGEVQETMPLPMRRRDIADFLGMTIETASRTLRRLERQKIIVIVRRGVRLLNPAAIEDLAWAR